MIFYKRTKTLIINWLKENGIYLLAVYSVLFYLTARNKKHIIEFFDLPINIKIEWIIGLPIMIFFYLIFMFIFSWLAFKFFLIFPYLIIKDIFNINAKIQILIDKIWEYIFVVFYISILILYAVHWFSDFSFYSK
jgi:hypothetical protein